MSSKINFEGHTGIHGFNNILKKLIVHSNRSHYIASIRLNCEVFVLDLKYRVKYLNNLFWIMNKKYESYY